MESTHEIYEMSDAAWALIEPQTLGRKGTWGGNAKDNRQFCNASFWILSTGATWRELPLEYGCWKNANKRFARWRNDGVWEKIMAIMFGQPEFQWLTTPQVKVRYRGKTQSTEHYWPWLRMICRSEALLQKIPRAMSVETPKSDVNLTGDNLLTAKSSQKKEAKEMVKKRNVKEEKGENAKSEKKVKEDTRSRVSYRVTLTREERIDLHKISTTGKPGSQKMLNAIILLRCDTGEFQDAKTLTSAQIAEVLPISIRKVDRVKQRFVEHGIEVALNGQEPNRQYDRKIDGDIEAHLVALACSEPPPGYAKWTLRLLADTLVELKIVDSISHETVRACLKKTL